MVCFIKSGEFFIFVETESTVCDSKKSRGTDCVCFFFNGWVDGEDFAAL